MFSIILMSSANRLIHSINSFIASVIFCHQDSSSDSDEISLSDEEDDDDDGPAIPACTPLASFLSFKQEAEKRRTSQVQLETTGKVVKLCHQIFLVRV